MKKITKMLILALALVVSFSLSAGSTAEAAKKKKAKPAVTKVTCVDKTTGKKSITLTKGKKATLKTTVAVKNTKSSKYKKVTYKTSNKKVATVSKKGVITAKKTGKATITVTSTKNKKKKAKVTVKVVAGKVTKVTLNKKTASLQEGEKLSLKATVKTKGKKPNKTVKWTTSNKNVATVSTKGVVTAKKAGTVKITAMSTDGTNKKATCTITVTAKPVPKTYKTTVTPADGKTVTVEVAFSDLAKLQSDVDKLAKFSKDTEVVVNLDGKDYTATVENGTVKINGKKLSESEKAKNAKKVTVKTTIKADKIASVVAFTPASVTSVKVGTVTFTSITDKSFNIGATKYTYSVDKTNIIVDGDASAALKGLGDIVKITVAEAK